MTLVRRLARPMLSAIFVSGGADSLRNPQPKAPAAEPVASPVARYLPYLPEDPEQLVKINAGVQVGAGALFALGRLPRLAALALAGSLVPTTLAGHRFWEESDPSRKAQQQIHFLKNLGLLGGLLLAAVDTEGKPSLGWRVRHLGRTGRRAAKTGARSAKATGQGAKVASRGARLAGRGAALGARGAAKAGGRTASTAVRTGRSVLGAKAGRGMLAAKAAARPARTPRVAVKRPLGLSVRVRRQAPRLAAVPRGVRGLGPKGLRARLPV